MYFFGEEGELELVVFFAAVLVLPMLLFCADNSGKKENVLNEAYSSRRLLLILLDTENYELNRKLSTQVFRELSTKKL